MSYILIFRIQQQQQRDLLFIATIFFFLAVLNLVFFAMDISTADKASVAFLDDFAVEVVAVADSTGANGTGSSTGL